MVAWTSWKIWKEWVKWEPMIYNLNEFYQKRNGQILELTRFVVFILEALACLYWIECRWRALHAYHRVRRARKSCHWSVWCKYRDPCRRIGTRHILHDQYAIGYYNSIKITFAFLFLFVYLQFNYLFDFNLFYFICFWYKLSNIIKIVGW